MIPGTELIIEIRRPADDLWAREGRDRWHDRLVITCGQGREAVLEAHDRHRRQTVLARSLCLAAPEF